MADILENFIVIEGLDGAGTTTQLKKVSTQLIKKGYNIHNTFEPTDRPIGKLVRDVLAKRFITTPLTLAKLYATDREDHLYNSQDGVIKHINDNEIVISDRYFYSSLAYQGVECDLEVVKSLNNYPHPQILIFIDTPVEECLNRINSRGAEKDIFEHNEFLEKVYNNYIKILKELPEKVTLIKIDGTLSVEKITQTIIGKLNKILK
ncbi:MAG: dTMP kinase [Sphaerochaetaceae bacterium]|nr:dTMP kinase [Sphaerochaetaceae bacterium]MDC7236916.1 dTMP kinase [Sphaerochaetaceae bacterium]MDC7248891.1 dTMP kinase [Sphaerochaetaceae bacterium]